MKCRKSQDIFSNKKQKNRENGKKQTFFKNGAIWSHMNQNGQFWSQIDKKGLNFHILASLWPLKAI